MPTGRIPITAVAQETTAIAAEVIVAEDMVVATDAVATKLSNGPSEKARGRLFGHVVDHGLQITVGFLEDS
jgi:hypothetical protein